MLLFLTEFPNVFTCEDSCALPADKLNFTGISAPTEQPDAQMEAKKARLVSFFHVRRNACAGAHFTVTHPCGPTK